MIPNSHAALAAQEQLREVAALVRKDLPNRLALGHLLITIRDKRLYELMLPPFQTWLEWLERDGGFESLTGLHHRTAHDAIYLAESKTLSALPSEEVEKFASVSNARHIAKMERNGQPVNGDQVKQAQTLKTKDFRRATGQSANGYQVKAWVEDPVAGAHLQAIVDILKRCTADALEQFRNRLAAIDVAGAPSPDNKLDWIMAAIDEGLRSPSQ